MDRRTFVKGVAVVVAVLVLPVPVTFAGPTIFVPGRDPTDNSHRLQALIDAGGEIRFRKEVIYLTRTIRITRSVRLIGHPDTMVLVFLGGLYQCIKIDMDWRSSRVVFSGLWVVPGASCKRDDAYKHVWDVPHHPPTIYNGVPVDNTLILGAGP